MKGGFSKKHDTPLFGCTHTHTHTQTHTHAHTHTYIHTHAHTGTHTYTHTHTHKYTHTHTPQGGFTVESGKAVTYTVCFSPGVEDGAYNHVMRLRVTNNPYEDYHVALSGEGFQVGFVWGKGVRVCIVFMQDGLCPIRTTR